MPQGIDSGDNHISISYLLRIDLNSRHFLLPKRPFSIFNPHLEVNEDVWHSSLPFDLIQHCWQLDLVSR